MKTVSLDPQDDLRTSFRGYGPAIVAVVACAIVIAAVLASWNAFRPMLERPRAVNWALALDAYFEAHGTLPQGARWKLSSTPSWRETVISDPAVRKALADTGTPTSPTQYGTICAIVHPKSVWDDGSQRVERRARDRTIIALYFLHSSDPPHPMCDIVVEESSPFFKGPGGKTTPIDVLDDVFVIALGGRVRFVQDPIIGDSIASFLLAPFEE